MTLSTAFFTNHHAQGLQTVSEDIADQPSPQPTIHRRPRLHDDTDSVSLEPSSSQASSRYSGTTALRQIEEDAADVDPDPIIEKLPHVLEEATLLLQDFEELIDTSEDPQRRRSYYRNSQRNSPSKDPFPRDNNSYIDRHVVLRSLFGASFIKVPDEARPDELIFKANLAIFAPDILLADQESSEIWERFQSLDLEFPNLFMSSLQDRKSRSLSIEPGSSRLRAETFVLALDIRTQYAIMLLKKHPNEPPSNVGDLLSQIFLTTSAQRHDQGRASIRGWQISGLNELSDAFRSEIMDRMQQISLCSLGEAGDNAAIDIEKLKAKYPWQEFVLDAGQWVRSRLLEIDEHISKVGGESKILKRIIAQRKNMIAQSGGANGDMQPGTMQRMANASTQPLPNHPKIKPDAIFASTSALGHGSRPSGPKKYTGITAAFSGEVSKRKSFDTTQAKQALASKANVSQMQALSEELSAPEIFEDDEGGQREDNFKKRNSGSSERRPGQSALEKAMRFHQSQVNPGKENVAQAQSSNSQSKQKRKRLAFIDPRSDAVTVGSDDRPQAVPRASTASSNAGKKRLDTEEEEEEDDIEPTQDQGFQIDNRVPDRSRRHAHPSTAPGHSSESPPSKKRRPNQRSKAQQAEKEDDNEWHPPPVDEDEQLRDEDDEEQLSGPSAQQIPATSSYQATAQLKREINAGKPRPVQTRRPWSRDAEERLIELVGELGPSYTEIKREDNATTKLFEGRDQVALKDKCRNMRFNYQ
ncbi:MAG: hypothetical protein Q9165_002928 [Trypethelium subeluteriae]